MTLFRCLAPSTDLDGGPHVQCSREHTNALVEMLELGVLWDKYGLVGDVVILHIQVTFTFLILIIFSAIY